MLCEKCGKNEATFYYEENINGAVKTYHLCADCAKAMQKSGEIPSMHEKDLWAPFAGLHTLFDQNGLLGSLLGAPDKGRTDTLKAGDTKETGRGEKVCPVCGASFADIVREGRAGCPACYETFADELAPSVRRMHGTLTHTGRAPAAYREKQARKQEMEQLEEQLRAAVQAERYEDAAVLRDKLKTMRDAQ